MPWTVIAVRAFADGIQTSVCEWRARNSSKCAPCASRPGDAFPEFLVLWALIPISSFRFSQSKLPGYILPSIPPITILTGDYLFRRRQPGLNRWVLLGHAVLCGVMAMSALLLPWFVAHGAQMPPDARAMLPLLASLGAALLILVVVKGFGVARLRLVTSCVLVVLVFFLYGVGPFFGIPAIGASKRVIHLLDRAYSARPLAERLAAVAPGERDRRRIPRPARHGVWPLFLSQSRGGELRADRRAGRAAPAGGARGRARRGPGDPRRPSKCTEGRHYEQLFTWPEQGLVVYLVGSR